jgi:hypothetical protein
MSLSSPWPIAKRQLAAHFTQISGEPSRFRGGAINHELTVIH